MKKFFKRIIIFALLIAGSSLLLKKYFYPELSLTHYSWGAELIHKKRLFLLQDKNEFNAVFLGSSMTFRQLNPSVFDQAVHAGDSTLRMRSFNFGVNWLSSAELFYLMDRLIKTDSLRPDYLFVELQKVKMVNYANYFTTRIKYWYTWDGIRFVIGAALSSRFSVLNKTAIIVSNVINYIGSLINLGYVTEATAFKTLQDNFSNMPDFVGKNQNGFVSLNEQDEINRRNKEIKDEERTNRFLKDTTVVTHRKRISERAFNYFDEHPEALKKFNKVYARKIAELISFCQSKNIYLVFYLPPRLDLNQQWEVIPILNAIDPVHRINLADARKYPEFYLARNSFDVTHMNETGAAIYSKAFAEEFLMLKKEKR